MSTLTVDGSTPLVNLMLIKTMAEFQSAMAKNAGQGAKIERFLPSEQLKFGLETAL